MQLSVLKREELFVSILEVRPLVDIQMETTIGGKEIVLNTMVTIDGKPTDMEISKDTV